jgi:hypothetical protein
MEAVSLPETLVITEQLAKRHVLKCAIVTKYLIFTVNFQHIKVARNNILYNKYHTAVYTMNRHRQKRLST